MALNRVNNNFFPILAPPGCLQYYMGATGNVESFNYRTTNLPVTTSTTVSPGSGIGPGPLQPNQALQVAANYLNNLNYGICVMRLPKMCAIKWNAIEFDFGGGAFGSSTPSKDCVSSGGGLVGNDADFLVIPFGTDRGRTNYVERFCGMRFSPSITESSLNEDVFCKFHSKLIIILPNPCFHSLQCSLHHARALR